MPSQTRTYKGSFATIADLSRKSIEELGWKVATHSTKEIVANAPASVLSWGEKITVVLKRGRIPATVELRVESDATAQLISWGKDGDNVQRFLAKVDERLRA